jgi:hypothetical protein
MGGNDEAELDSQTAAQCLHARQKLSTLLNVNQTEERVADSADLFLTAPLWAARAGR